MESLKMRFDSQDNYMLEDLAKKWNCDKGDALCRALYTAFYLSKSVSYGDKIIVDRLGPVNTRLTLPGINVDFKEVK